MLDLATIREAIEKKCYISLKTGEISDNPEIVAVNNQTKYDPTLVEIVHRFYISGQFNPKDSTIFGFSNPKYFIAVFRRANLPTLNLSQTKTFYRSSPKPPKVTKRYQKKERKPIQLIKDVPNIVTKLEIQGLDPKSYIKNFLQQFNFEITENYFLNNFLFDFYIKEKNLFLIIPNIEQYSNKNVHRNYFSLMHKEVQKVNGQLMILNEQNVVERTKIIESMIQNKLGQIQFKIPARKTILKEVPNEEAKVFLEQNHLDGYSIAKIRFGLYYNDELVTLMTFDRNRFHIDKSSGYELVRSCSKLNTIVQGGCSKILKHFKSLYNESLESYVDKNISTYANSYKNWTFVKDTPPDLYFVANNKLWNRSYFMKHKLHKSFDFPDRNDPNYDSYNTLDFLASQNIYPYYGAGNFLFRLD